MGIVYVCEKDPLIVHTGAMGGAVGNIDLYSYLCKSLISKNLTRTQSRNLDSFPFLIPSTLASPVESISKIYVDYVTVCNF